MDREAEVRRKWKSVGQNLSEREKRLSREVVVSLIGATTTKEGLRVRAALDDREYETGVRVSDAEFRAIALKPDKFHGDWNYRISARRSP